jgi:hypothetical protein
MPLFFGGQGVTPSLGGQTSNVLALAAGQCYLVPAGWFEVKPGKYTSLQEYDPITGIWRTIGAGSLNANVERIHSDGVNYRLANQTGCAVGALLTAAGSGYVSPPTVTASAGGSVWRAILGGAVNTVVTITNGGVNYTYPPAVVFAAPPSGGIQATGFATIAAGVVTGVTVTDQGAGYVSPPVIQFVNDPREGQNNITTGFNAAAIATLTGAGTVTGLLCLDHGTPQTALPTLAFSGGGGTGAAATTIMCWTVTAFTVTSGGTALPANTVLGSYGFNFPATASAYINPTTQSQLLKVRQCYIRPGIAGGVITVANTVVDDGGIYPAIPTLDPIAGSPGSGGTAAAVLVAVVGGVSDISVVLGT